jgi:hypothetical protein
MTTKKAAVKKETKKVTETVEALKEFQGNVISRDGNYITFGCGSVSVERADVLALAEVIDLPAFKKMANPLKTIEGYYDMIRFEDVDDFVSAATALANLMKTYKRGTEALITLIGLSNNDYSVDELLSISSKELLAIAGPKPTKNVKAKA